MNAADNAFVLKNINRGINIMDTLLPMGMAAPAGSAQEITLIDDGLTNDSEKFPYDTVFPYNHLTFSFLSTSSNRFFIN